MDCAIPSKGNKSLIKKGIAMNTQFAFASTSNTPYLKISLFSALIFASAALAEDIEGQIYPNAFPVGEEISLQAKNVSINRLSQAIERCTGLATIEVAKQIFPEVNPQTFDYDRGLGRVPAGAGATYSAGYFFREVSNLKLPVMDTYILSTGRSAYLGVYQNSEDDSFKGSDKLNGYLVILPNPLSLPNSQNAMRAIWPQLSFDRVERAGRYTDFGAPINPVVYAENLKIVKPAGFDSVVRFENVKSGVATRFTADYNSYVECLQSELLR